MTNAFLISDMYITQMDLASFAKFAFALILLEYLFIINCNNFIKINKGIANNAIAPKLVNELHGYRRRNQCGFLVCIK